MASQLAVQTLKSKLALLQSSIFPHGSLAASRLHPSRSKDNWHTLTTYYPPNLNNLQLSKQDKSLLPLHLRDEVYDDKRRKELALERRRKVVRVSVLGGRFPADTSGDKKKKKKKK